MSRNRSVWSSKGIAYPTDPIPGMPKLVEELKKCAETIRQTAPYESAIIVIAANRLTQDPREDDISGAGYFLTSSAVARRDMVQKVGWAEVPEQAQTQEAIMRAGTLLHEYVRLVMRGVGRKDEECTVEDVLKSVHQ